MKPFGFIIFSVTFLGLFYFHFAYTADQNPDPDACRKQLMQRTLKVDRKTIIISPPIKTTMKSKEPNPRVAEHVIGSSEHYILTFSDQDRHLRIRTSNDWKLHATIPRLGILMDTLSGVEFSPSETIIQLSFTEGPPITIDRETGAFLTPITQASHERLRLKISMERERLLRGNQVIAVSRDARWIVSISSDGELINFYSRTKLLPEKSIHVARQLSRMIIGASFSFKGDFFVFGTTEGHVIGYDMSVEPVRKFRIDTQKNSAITAVSIHPTTSLVLAGYEDGAVRLVRVSDGKVAEIVKPASEILAPALGTLTGTRKHGATDFVTSAKFSPNGLFIGIGVQTGFSTLFDGKTGKPLTDHIFFDSQPTRLEGQPLRETPLQGAPLQDGTNVLCEFSPNSRFYANVSKEGKLRMFDLIARQKLPKTNPNDQKITAIAFSPDSSYIALALESGIVYIHDVLSGQLMAQLLGNTNSISTLVFTEDGQTLIAKSNCCGFFSQWNLHQLATVF